MIVVSINLIVAKIKYNMNNNIDCILFRNIELLFYLNSLCTLNLTILRHILLSLWNIHI